MSGARFFAVAVLLLSFTGIAFAAKAPVAVSPGEVSKLALIEGRCPTFSWGGVEGASSYELVVYRLADGGEEAKAILKKGIPGRALGWTPALGACLDRGGQYAWTVRAQTKKTTSEWSTPSLFQVAGGPSEKEFEAALEIVNAYLVAREEEVRETAQDRPASSGTGHPNTFESPVPLAPPPGTLLSIAGNVDATSFSGSGSGLTSVDAETLDGIDSTAFSTGAHTPDTNCDGSDCDLRDPSLVSCNTIDTDASGNLICGVDQGGDIEVDPQVENVVAGKLCLGKQLSADGSVTAVACEGITLCDALSYRFIDLGDGTIHDCATGLFWLKQASCVALNPLEPVLGLPEESFYGEAEDAVANLGDGVCGLTDTSTPGDWRLPTVFEWCKIENPGVQQFDCPPSSGSESMLDTSLSGSPKVPNGLGIDNWREEDAFVGPLVGDYWGSGWGGEPWGVRLVSGGLFVASDGFKAFVWAVRDPLPWRPPPK